MSLGLGGEAPSIGGRRLESTRSSARSRATGSSAKAEGSRRSSRPPRRPAPLPDTLDAFHAWLATTADLPFAAPPGAAGNGRSAIPPRG